MIPMRLLFQVWAPARGDRGMQGVCRLPAGLGQGEEQRTGEWSGASAAADGLGEAAPPSLPPRAGEPAWRLADHGHGASHTHHHHRHHCQWFWHRHQQLQRAVVVETATIKTARGSAQCQSIYSPRIVHNFSAMVPACSFLNPLFIITRILLYRRYFVQRLVFFLQFHNFCIQERPFMTSRLYMYMYLNIASQDLDVYYVKLSTHTHTGKSSPLGKWFARCVLHIIVSLPRFY